jgi:ferredoxin
MPKLIFDDTQEEVALPEGSPIAPSCEEAGVPFACTEGVCGTCVIEVLEGKEGLSPFNEAEGEFFGDEGQERLACQCQIMKGTVRIKF